MESVQDVSAELWLSARPALQRAQEGAGSAWAQLSTAAGLLAARASQVAGPLLERCQPALDLTDQHLGRLRPWQLVAASALAAWLLLWLWRACCTALADFREKGGPARLCTAAAKLRTSS